MTTPTNPTATPPYKLFPPQAVFRTILDLPLDEAEQWIKGRVVAQGRNYETGVPMLDHFALLVSRHLHRSALFYARSLGLSTEHLNGAIIALTGMTTVQWVDAYVMLAACQLLAQPQPTIGQIGRMLGFNTIQVFSRFFGQRQKMTPYEYRGLMLRGKARKYSRL